MLHRTGIVQQRMLNLYSPGVNCQASRLPSFAMVLNTRQDDLCAAQVRCATGSLKTQGLQEAPHMHMRAALPARLLDTPVDGEAPEQGVARVKRSPANACLHCKPHHAPQLHHQQKISGDCGYRPLSYAWGCLLLELRSQKRLCCEARLN